MTFLSTNKNKRISGYFIALYCCFACKCEGTFKVISVFENSSSHNIKIAYSIKQNVKLGDFSIPISTSQTVDIASGRSRGDWNVYLDRIYTLDSISITFDNSKKLVHYGPKVVQKNSNAILYSDSRNIFNEKSYEKNTLIDDGCYLETEYKYTFTEQDYLNAK